MVRVVISDPESGDAYQVEPSDAEFSNLVGKTIGETFEGDLIGFSGYEFEIKGGSDEEGFPMRGDVQGEGRTKSLLSSGPGYKQKRDGERRRKTVRGKKVSTNIAQLNVMIKERGEESVEEVLGLESGDEEEEEEKETEED